MVLFQGAASASALEEAVPPACDPASLFVQLDNDLLGGRDQDQGYTAGAKAAWSLPVGDGCPAETGKVKTGNAIRDLLDPASSITYARPSDVVSLEYAIYTPEDPLPDHAMRGDRPYAGVLMFSFARAARNDSMAAMTGLHVGLVGPAAQGKQVHQGVHRMMGSERFHGWRDQLENEPLLGISHERRRRWKSPETAQSRALDWDVISRWSGTLGNRITDVQTGLEIRLGAGLPDDFGSFPGRNAGAAWQSGSPRQSWSGHFFLAAGIQWVMRDITLDGNTFTRSHRVQRKSFVAEAAYGLVLNRGAWSFAVMRTHRSREFEGQRDAPVYGSLLVTRSFWNR